MTGLGGDELFLGYNKYYDFLSLKFKLKKFLYFGIKNIDLPLLCKSKTIGNLTRMKSIKNGLLQILKEINIYHQ